MPRDGSDIYHIPPGTQGTPNTTIESAKYNAFAADLEQDANLARPIVAGGTGASNITQARTNLLVERAMQVITNFDSATWEVGSFYAASTATAPPGGLAHRFAGIVYGPDANNLVIEARDLDDASTPGLVWVREKNAGVWGAWTTELAGFTGSFVLKVGDTMTGNLSIIPASGNARIILDHAASGGNSHILGRKGGLSRWQLLLGNNDAESAGNAGANFQLTAFDDAGGTPLSALVINRATLAAVFGGALTAAGDITGVNLFLSGNEVISKTAPALVLDRPDDTAAVILTRKNTGTPLPRWRLNLGDGTAESSTATGADFRLEAFNNAGASLGTYLYMPRSTGLLELKGDPTAALGAATKQYVDTRVVVNAAPFDAMAYNGMQTNNVFEVGQQYGPGTGATTNGYFCDGWQQFTSNGTLQSSFPATTAIPGFSNVAWVNFSVAMTGLAASEAAYVQHLIEGYRVARLSWGNANAAPLTLAFWIATNRAGNYGLVVKNGANNRSYGVLLNCAGSNIYEYKTVTIPGDVTGTWDKTNGTGLKIIFSFAAGSSLLISPSTWSAVNGHGVTGQGTFNALNDWMQVVGLVAVSGSQAPPQARLPFLARPLDDELLIAQRYFFKSWNHAQPTGAGNGINTGEFQNFATRAGALYHNIYVRFPVELRATPTVAAFNPAAVNLQCRDISLGADCSATSATNASTKGFTINTTLNAATAAGNLIGAHAYGDARLA